MYTITYKSGKKYMGETGGPLNTRIAEHNQKIKMGELCKFKIAEHFLG
jgi:predicted GIY-YIG superfamily endonuclease